MPRTFVRQDLQIRKSDAYTDSLSAGVTLETSSAHIEDDLNGLRSQVNRIIDDSMLGKWYDPIPTVNGKTRSIKDLNFDLNDVEEHKFLFRSAVLTDIPVPVAQNWKILSVAATEAPAANAAVTLATNGAVVAQSTFSGAAFNVHELIEVPGPNAVAPKNLVIVRDAISGQVLQSSGRAIFGLLQYESTGVNGGAFDDVSGGNRVKISFVRMNATYDDLEAVPVVDIAGKIVNYLYVFRLHYDVLPEEAFLDNGSDFIDQSALTEAEHEILDTLVHEIAETCFLKITRSSGQVSNVTIWTDAFMTTKIREILITRAFGQVSVVVEKQYDAFGVIIPGQTLTSTITRSGGQVDNISAVET